MENHFFKLNLRNKKNKKRSANIRLITGTDEELKKRDSKKVK